MDAGAAGNDGLELLLQRRPRRRGRGRHRRLLLLLLLLARRIQGAARRFLPCGLTPRLAGGRAGGRCMRRRRRKGWRQLVDGGGLPGLALGRRREGWCRLVDGGALPGLALRRRGRGERRGCGPLLALGRCPAAARIGRGRRRGFRLHVEAKELDCGVECDWSVA